MVSEEFTTVVWRPGNSERSQNDPVRSNKMQLQTCISYQTGYSYHQSTSFLTLAWKELLSESYDSDETRGAELEHRMYSNSDSHNNQR